MAAFCLLTVVFCAPDAFGHASGENYVWINVAESHLEGRFEINFTDLEKKLGIKVSPDSAEQTVVANASRVQEYFREHFQIIANGKELPYEFTETTVFGDPPKWAQYYYKTAETGVPDTLTIRNDIFLQDDVLHRSLLVMDFNKKTGNTYQGDFAMMIFSPTKTEQELDLLNVQGLMGWRDFVWEGMRHIWIGIDHILFLVALLLPAVLVRKEGTWSAVPDFPAAFWNILKIVTIFTIAHSITLGLAALNIVQLPPRMVESVIALSIVLVGLNTIYPTFSTKISWLVIFFFGLFHGLGFASVMGELPFRMISLMKVLISFNVGVELGQLVIVAAVFPVIFFFRESRAYLPFVLRGGTFVIVLVASYWFVERAFGL